MRRPHRRVRPDFFSPRNICRILGFGAILLFVTTCGEEEQIVVEIRSLKTVTVGEATAGEVRSFSGIVRAVDRSALSFEVPGNVVVVNVDIGDKVKKGQVLAELDKEPYELEVQKAEAELVTAKASVKNQRADYEREKSIFEQGAGSERRMDQAEFAFKEAEASLDFVGSKLNLAKRDLRKTVLYAPYDGSIGERQVEPFVEVRRGQAVFEIDGKGEQEIVVDIPETVIHLLTIDMPVVVSFPTIAGKTTKGSVTEVGTVAGEGNAFPAKVRLLDPPSQVRSGMTAEATFELKGDDFADGYPVPGHAITPTTEANRGFVFVYQPDTSTVKKVPIQWRGVKNNMIMISEGVSPGDILAVAGVSFLSDGMKVKLMAEARMEKPETLDVE
jgi:RND family efflux transporter MFP subunit